MEKKEILYFESDDASELGMNGKQVFFTKRINGKTTHNKIPNQEENELKQNDEEQVGEKKQNNIQEDLFIEFKNPYYEPEKDNKSNFNRKNKQKKNIVKKKNKNSIKNGKNVKKNNNKNAKKRKRRQRIIKFVLLLILITGTIVFALVSPIFNIQKIEVKGNVKIDSSTITSLSNLKIGNNIFKNSKTEIIKNIKENQYIDNVEIRRKLPETIEIVVKERTIAYQIQVIDSYIYIDYQGYLLEKSANREKVPIIEGIETDQDTLLSGKRIKNEDIESLNAILKIMKNAKNIQIENLINKIIIDNQKEYILCLNSEKKYIYLGDIGNITNKMLYIQVILEKEKGISGSIFLNGDLNNGFKPYFREKQGQEGKVNE